MKTFDNYMLAFEREIEILSEENAKSKNQGQSDKADFYDQDDLFTMLELLALWENFRNKSSKIGVTDEEALFERFTQLVVSKSFRRHHI